MENIFGLTPKGRSLRGNVDRNVLERLVKGQLKDVVPYVGTWIEIDIETSNIDKNGHKSFPTWERG